MTRTFRIITIALLAFVVYIGLLMATAANAHDGPGTWHPVACEDVDVPPGVQCWEPSTYTGQQDVDHDHGPDYHLTHPVCEGVKPGQGSAAGAPYWYECLPETGSEHSLLAIFGGMALAAGAATLILGGKRQAIRDGMKESGDA